MRAATLVTMAMTMTIGACTGEGRHTMTDKDVAAMNAAKTNGDSSWTDTESTTHALTCIQYQEPYHFCTLYKRDPVAGQWDCTSDTTAYNGEVLMFDQPNAGGFSCVGWTGSPDFPTIGDWDNNVRSIKNHANYFIDLYSETYYNPGYHQRIGDNWNTPINMDSTVVDRVSSIVTN